MERLKRFWNAFRNVAILFSFLVNFVLIVLLLAISVPAIRAVFALKTGMVEPLLNDLDAAFVGLGESTIDTEIQVNAPVGIEFALPLDQSLETNFDLTIEQDTEVVMTREVPLELPAQFILPGGGGAIYGTVSLALPTGMVMPIHLSMIVPVRQTIPVRGSIPVSQTVNIQMPVPVHIQLGQSGLDPAVQQLRDVFQPLRTQVESLPDGLEFR